MNNMSFKEWLYFSEADTPAEPRSFASPAARRAPQAGRFLGGSNVIRAAMQNLRSPEFIDAPGVHGAGPSFVQSPEDVSAAASASASDAEKTAKRTRAKSKSKKLGTDQEALALRALQGNIPIYAPQEDERKGMVSLHGGLKKSPRKYDVTKRNSFSQAIGVENAEQMNKMFEDVTGLFNPSWVDSIFMHLRKTKLATQDVTDQYEKALSAMNDFISEYYPSTDPAKKQKWQNAMSKLDDKYGIMPEENPEQYKRNVMRRTYGIMRRLVGRINRIDMMTSGMTFRGQYKAGLTGREKKDVRDILKQPEEGMARHARDYMTSRKMADMARYLGDEEAANKLSQQLGIKIPKNAQEKLRNIQDEFAQEGLASYIGKIEQQLDKLKVTRRNKTRDIAKAILPQVLGKNPPTEAEIAAQHGISLAAAHNVMTTLWQATLDMANRQHDQRLISLIERLLRKKGLVIVRGKIAKPSLAQIAAGTPAPTPPITPPEAASEEEDEDKPVFARDLPLSVMRYDPADYARYARNPFRRQ